MAPVLSQTHAEIWAKEWELKVEDERALYFACADLLRLSKVRPASPMLRFLRLSWKCNRLKALSVLQKKKAGPLDAHRLTLKALSTYQVS